MKKVLIALIILLSFNTHGSGQVWTAIQIDSLISVRDSLNNRWLQLAGPSNLLTGVKHNVLETNFADTILRKIVAFADNISTSTGDLAAVLAVGNTATNNIQLDNGAFMTDLSGPATQIYSVGSLTLQSYLGMVGGLIPTLKLKSGGLDYYNTIIANPSLTGTHGAILPNEGTGTGTASEIVLHTTANPITVGSSGGANSTIGTSNIAINAGGNVIASLNNNVSNGQLYLRDGLDALGITFEGVPYTGSLTSSRHYYPPDANGTLCLRADTVGGSTDFPILITSDYLSTHGGTGNIATTSLTATGNYTHDWADYGTTINNINSWAFGDTLDHYLLSMNDAAAAGTSLVTLTHSRIADQFNVKTGSANNLIVDSANNNTSILHLTGNSGTPSIAAGLGAGTLPTVSMGSGSTDISGYINVTTGSVPSSSAIVVTVTFVSAYSSAPRCIIIKAANSLTSTSVSSQTCYVDQSGITATTFDISSAAVALTASSDYKFYYWVVQ